MFVGVVGDREDGARLNRVKNLTGLVEWCAVFCVYTHEPVGRLVGWKGPAAGARLIESCASNHRASPCLPDNPPALTRYGRNGRLRSLANLVIVGGVIDPSHTGDREEAAECEKMHTLIDKYGLRVRSSHCFVCVEGGARGAGVCKMHTLIDKYGLTVSAKVTTWGAEFEGGRRVRTA